MQLLIKAYIKQLSNEDTIEGISNYSKLIETIIQKIHEIQIKDSQIDKILLCALATAILSEHILKHNEPKTQILELVKMV